MTISPRSRRSRRLMVHAVRAGLCALGAALAWAANAGTWDALLAGSLVAWLWTPRR